MADSLANPASGEGREIRLAFDEFTPPTSEEWRAAAVESLKGIPFDKLLTHTYDGLDLQPIYRSADMDGLTHPHTLPGLAPFVRGASASGYLSTPWAIAQEINSPDPQTMNESLRFDLERGQTAIALSLDEAGCLGLDPDQAAVDQVGSDGTSLSDITDMATALAGIDLTTTPLYLHCGSLALASASQYIAFVRRQANDTARLRGGLLADPIGALIRSGTLPIVIDQAYDEMAALTAWSIENAPLCATMSVRSDLIHDGGGNAAQELAFAMATGVAYLRAMTARGLQIDAIASRMRFTFALGANFFNTIAKLRAARLVWSQIAEAFGAEGDACAMIIDGRTSQRNKTALDAHVNLLRATTEALSGALGGANSMHIAPYDAPYAYAGEFSRRIARNTQLILQHECSLSELVDPAGGAWYVEWLTDQLGRKAWSLFQEIEELGGVIKALEDGVLQMEIDNIAKDRRRNLAQRREVLVGVNMYPDPGEKIPKPFSSNTRLVSTRADAVRTRRRTESPSRTIALQRLRQCRTPSTEQLELAISAAEAGATLNQLVDALRPVKDESQLSIEPIPIRRDAAPFEDLRRAMSVYGSQTGAPVRIFLANMGPVAQHKARADFAAGFFRVGGFEIISPAGFATPQDAAEGALESDAQVVVVCSTDDTYPKIVPPLITRIRQSNPATTVVLAGYPKEQIDMLRAAGVDEFIYVHADCYGINRRLQEKLGIIAKEASA